MDPLVSPHPAEASASAPSRGQLIDVLTDLVGDLDALDLSLEHDGVDRARRLRTSLTTQVRDHVLPRLADADTPAVVVVGGSTGAGKSTLVNSVLGQEVSEAGVLRPTTRVPVLVLNPEDADVLAGHPVAEVARSVTCAAVPAGLAVVDASDLDSVHASNRELASRLLEAADLWLFVTTAARYGDAVPWETLEDARRKGTSIAVILNRVPSTVLAEVRRDLLGRLAALGLAEAPFFVVPDAGPHEGLLPADFVAELGTWLRLLAGRHRAAGLVRRTGRGLWTTLRTDLLALADDVDAQTTAARDLEDHGLALAATPARELTSEVARGVCGEGAPTTRWLSLASAGGPLADLVQGGHLRRGFLGRRARARTDALDALASECRESLAARLQAALIAVHGDARLLWDSVGAGEAAERLLPVPVAAGQVVEAWACAAAPADAVVPRGLDPLATRDLVVAAATGVEGAAAAAARQGLEATVDGARASLTGALDQAVTGMVPVGAALSLAPDPALPAALRLRAGELKPFARTGATS